MKLKKEKINNIIKYCYYFVFINLIYPKLSYAGSFKKHGDEIVNEVWKLIPIAFVLACIVAMIHCFFDKYLGMEKIKGIILGFIVFGVVIPGGVALINGKAQGYL